MGGTGHQTRRFGRWRRPGDQFFWAVAAIQPLDVGIGAWQTHLPRGAACEIICRMNPAVVDVLKDPAVVAALVALPVAVLASVASFAAGSLQGRGAYRGPVDAVRRQHQREAYAAFLAALWTYSNATNWDGILGYTQMSRAAAGLAANEGEERTHAFLQLSGIPTQQVHTTLSLVFLEGPDVIAGAANEATAAVQGVHQAALAGAHNAGTPTDNELIDAYRAAHFKLYERINEFALLARKHLNSKR